MDLLLSIKKLQQLPKEIAAIIEANYKIAEPNIITYCSKGTRRVRTYYGIIVGLDRENVYSFDHNVETPHLLLLWITFGGNDWLISHSATKFVNRRPPQQHNGVSTAIEHVGILMRSAMTQLNYIRHLVRPFQVDLIKPEERLLLQPKYDGVRYLALIENGKIMFRSKKIKSLTQALKYLMLL